MRTILFPTLALVLAVLAAPAAKAASYETMFGGYPAHSDQRDLRELQPNLLADHKLNREQGCMAAALYFEARGESEEGQIAVGRVILNRVLSKAYPDTICGVVWQNSHRKNACQFSFTCDGSRDLVKETERWNATKKLAVDMLGNRTVGEKKTARELFRRLGSKTRQATHYHADYVSPAWGRKLARTDKIGRHIFYISKRVARTIPAGAIDA